MVRIKRIGIKQTAKVIAVFYFVISIIFVLPISLITLLVGSSGNKASGVFPQALGGVFLLLIPVFYAVIGFVMVALTAFIYNFIAKRFGGVEIELDSEDSAPPPSS